MSSHAFACNSQPITRLISNYNRGFLMTHVICSMKRFLNSEDGPTAVEYAVMLALIVVVCLTAIQAIGTNANTTFNKVATTI